MVFPAGAGVFPKKVFVESEAMGFPRRRGGVSKKNYTFRFDPEFSPQARGCFHPESRPCHSFIVFPADAVVFLKS